LKSEPDAVIGQKRGFFKGLKTSPLTSIGVLESMDRKPSKPSAPYRPFENLKVLLEKKPFRLSSGRQEESAKVVRLSGYLPVVRKSLQRSFLTRR